MTLQCVHCFVSFWGIVVFSSRARQLRGGQNGKLASVYLEHHEFERQIGKGNQRRHGDIAVSCFGVWYQPCSSLFHVPHPFQGENHFF